jgi:molybdopterin molybdotransferase
MMNKEPIGYKEAIDLTLNTIHPLGIERLPLIACTDRIAAESLYAKVNSPSVDASLKDGFAIRSHEIGSATPENPIRLKVIGTTAAGEPSGEEVRGGTAIRILTGAKLPVGADAVLSEEFTVREGDALSVFNDAKPGRNIMFKGSDVAEGDLINAKGDCLSPGRIGLLAAAGHGNIPVYCRPKVAIIATGDEVVVPGQPLPEGKLYASNLATLNSWCIRYGMQTSLSIVSDNRRMIAEKLAEANADHDAILTSGGAWTGDRDYVAATLESLGWKQHFHRIRIGPGKAVGFGMLNDKPVFLLPGGPPSNLLAFLQIALPGLLRLSGRRDTGLPRMMVKLKTSVKGRHIDWIHYVFGTFHPGEEYTYFEPLKLVSRLKSMAGAEGVITIPEGINELDVGTILPAQLLV